MSAKNDLLLFGGVGGEFNLKRGLIDGIEERGGVVDFAEVGIFIRRGGGFVEEDEAIIFKKHKVSSVDGLDFGGIIGEWRGEIVIFFAGEVGHSDFEGEFLVEGARSGVVFEGNKKIQAVDGEDDAGGKIWLWFDSVSGVRSTVIFDVAGDLVVVNFESNEW